MKSPLSLASMPLPPCSDSKKGFPAIQYFNFSKTHPSLPFVTIHPLNSRPRLVTPGSASQPASSLQMLLNERQQFYSGFGNPSVTAWPGQQGSTEVTSSSRQDQPLLNQQTRVCLIQGCPTAASSTAMPCGGHMPLAQHTRWGRMLGSHPCSLRPMQHAAPSHTTAEQAGPTLFLNKQPCHAAARHKGPHPPDLPPGWNIRTPTPLTCPQAGTQGLVTEDYWG